MLDFFFLLDRRYQLEIVDKVFDMIRIHAMIRNVNTSSHQCELDMRLLNIIKKLVKQLIMDDFTIKMNKNVAHLIDRFNCIQKKRAIYNQPVSCDKFEDLVRVAAEDDEDECS
jgi:hypothetical protein